MRSFSFLSRETHEVITTLTNGFWFRFLPGVLPKLRPREATKTEQKSQRMERREQKRSVYAEVAEMWVSEQKELP